jgi:hypothetical protein
MAWLSDAAGSPSTRFTQATVPYLRMDGVAIANNWAGLTSGTLLAALNVTENGGLPPSNEVWSDTAANGAISTPIGDCSNWTSNTTSFFGELGHLVATDSTWTDEGIAVGCNNSYPLYCFEQ